MSKTPRSDFAVSKLITKITYVIGLKKTPIFSTNSRAKLFSDSLLSDGLLLDSLLSDSSISQSTNPNLGFNREQFKALLSVF